MRQNWVEFEAQSKKKCLLRPEYIISIVEDEVGTAVAYEGGDGVADVPLNEPYEQVKQKIIDAEKYEPCVVEHFTRDEYEKIAAVMRAELKECIEDGVDIERATKIIDKLNEILKEDK